METGDDESDVSRLEIFMLLCAATVLFTILALLRVSDTVAAQQPTNESSVIPHAGSQISKLRFTDIRALNRSLEELGKHQAYVFVFTTTDCPLVRRYMPQLNELYARYHGSDVAFVAINVGAGDTLRDIASQAIEYESSWIFVRDFDLNCVKASG